MSRLPTLSTPGRTMNGSPGTGIPTPTARRPRSSLGPNLMASVSKPDPEMDQAFKDAVRRRPPSSLGMGKDSDPDTPTQKPPSAYLSKSTADRALPAPRTPGLRPRTPSSIATPSRPASRPTLSGRPSLASSTTTPARRPSMASSTSTTPYRRPESRAGVAASDAKWSPQVGDRVRLPSHGYEGTLRYLGPTHIRDGIWAGVELEGGFQGKGRNDGSVDGVRYFECAPNCGIFTLSDKLAPPTSTGPPVSRPASVASQRSLASSYSASGRATPSMDRTRRTGATTPGLARSTRGGATTPSNAAVKAAGAVAKITEGSRASKYLGMTAKQLDAREPPGPASNALAASTSATPRVSKMGASTTTPGRMGRPSLGGSLATPKARLPRMSSASEMMPPPPSPQASKVQPNHVSTNSYGGPSSAMEEELQELRRRNAELEEQLNDVDIDSHLKRNEELQASLEAARGEADGLRSKLSSSNGDANGVREQVDQLQSSSGKLQDDLNAKNKELDELRREMRIAEERAASELEAGIEAKREEVRKVHERLDGAEAEAAELKKLVDELTSAGNQLIEINESKQYELQSRIAELEEKLQSATEDAARAQQKAETAASEEGSPRKVTAAEIDNETLNEQVKHLQNRIHSLEEQLDEARAQGETDSDAWQAKYNKARDAEREVVQQLERTKGEMSKLTAEASATQTRIAELQTALTENQAELESSRAEIETLRAEATQTASTKALRSSESETRIAELQTRLEKADAADQRAKSLEAKVASLEGELSSLRKKSIEGSPGRIDEDGEPVRGITRRTPRLSSGSIEEAEKSIRGYHHIVSEMQEENAQLKNKVANLQDEIGMLKEEIKLLQDINESDVPASGDELVKLRGTIKQQSETIKEFEREVAELESLIESKIYHEDELETRLQDMEAELGRLRKGQASHKSHSRNESIASATDASNGDESRCELCEGPHELDACPIFSGQTLDAGSTSPLAIKKKKWCADCESSAHDTADCPMAEDVF